MDILLIILILTVLILNIVFFIKFKKEPKNNENELDKVKQDFDGLKDSINLFEVIILEVSLHSYNKNSPLFNEVIKYMKDKNFNLYDLFDLIRLGSNESFLVQFDCVFVRNNSKLLDV